MRARPGGQVIQNGACSEKKQSEKRNDEFRVAAMDAIARATSAQHGNSAMSERRQRVTGIVNKNNGRKITADSFDSSAKANKISPVTRRTQLRPRDSAKIQHSKEPRPKRSMSNSLTAENHITAS